MSVDVLLTAWGTKEGSRFKTWKRRFFVLSTVGEADVDAKSKGVTHLLRYYKKRNDANAVNQPLGVVTITKVVTTVTELRRGKRRCLLITTPGAHSRNFFVAPERDFAEWQRALTDLTPPANAAELRRNTLGEKPAPIALDKGVGDDDDGKNAAAAAAAADEPPEAVPVTPDTAMSVHHLVTVLRPMCLDKLEEAMPGNASDATIEHMVDKVIKPLTKSRSYVEHQARYAPTPVEDHVGQACAMLSYTWGYRFCDVIRAVEHWTKSTGRDPKRTYVWICSLCVNQHDAFAADNPAEHFEDRVHSIGTLLPLLLPWNKPQYLGRLWCLFELWITIRGDKHKCKVEVVFTPEEIVAIQRLMATVGMRGFETVIDSINCESADAKMLQDKEFIRGAIEKTTGFSFLNRVVESELRRLYMSLGDGGILPEKQGPMTQLYLAVDTSEGQFLQLIREASEALRVVFVNEKVEGHAKPVNLSAKVGAALGPAVKDVVGASVPCMLWWATGPDVLALADVDGGAGTVDSSSAGCSFVSELKQADVAVDFAVVCMKYGAEWAAAQLCATKTARCAVWVAADPAEAGHGAVLRSVAGLVRDILRRPLAEHVETSVGDLKSLVSDGWRRHFSTLSSARHGVVLGEMKYSESQRGLFHSLQGANTTVQVIEMHVPSGNYFESVMHRGLGAAGTPSSTTGAAGEVDAAHFVAAREMGNRVLQRLRARDGPTVLHAVPSWGDFAPSVQGGDGGAEAAAGDISDILHYVCGQSSCVHSEVQFVCHVTLTTDGRLTDDVVVGVPKHKSGIVWVRTASGGPLSFDEANAVWLAVEKWRGTAAGPVSSMAGWSFVVETPRDVWRQMLNDDMYNDDDAVLVREAPLNQRVHCSRCDLIRVKNAAALSPAKVRDALHAVIDTDHGPWVGGMYVDGGDMVVSVILHGIRFFQRLRGAVLLDSFSATLQRELGATVALDKALFSRQFASILMEFDELTPHQRAKAAEWGDIKRVAVQGPAGSGKTFLALDKLYKALKTPEAIGSSRFKSHVLFVALNEALCFFFGRWLFHKMVKNMSDSLARRMFNVCNGIWVLCEANGGVPQRLTVTRNCTLEIDPTSADSLPDTFAFVVVDEAHHIYSRGDAEAHDVFATDLDQLLGRSAEACAFCSDLSQVEASGKTAIPPVEKTIRLTEVVRNSARVVQASAAFLTLPDEISAFNDTPGPPLLPFVFKACKTEEERRKRYTELVVKAIARLEADFEGLPLHGNTAVLVPDASWAEWLRKGLLEATPKGSFEFVDALTGARTVGGSAKAGDGDGPHAEQIIVDGIATFDGMERLIVIAVGLDTGGADASAKEASCSRIYRALTRAHMFAVVVQEHMPSGWLEYLSVVKHDPTAADEAVAKRSKPGLEPPSPEPPSPDVGTVDTDSGVEAAGGPATVPEPDVSAAAGAEVELKASSPVAAPDAVPGKAVDGDDDKASHHADVADTDDADFSVLPSGGDSEAAGAALVVDESDAQGDADDDTGAAGVANSGERGASQPQDIVTGPESDVSHSYKEVRQGSADNTGVLPGDATEITRSALAEIAKVQGLAWRERQMRIEARGGGSSMGAKDSDAAAGVEGKRTMPLISQSVWVSNLGDSGLDAVIGTAEIFSPYAIEHVELSPDKAERPVARREYIQSNDTTVYENERLIDAKGWSSEHLGRRDPRQWSKLSASTRATVATFASIDRVPIPSGFPSPGYGWSKEGWTATSEWFYADSFDKSSVFVSIFKATDDEDGPAHRVRRRRWVLEPVWTGKWEFERGNSKTAVDFNSILARLLELRGSRPGKVANLLEREIIGITAACKQIFLSQPVLLEIEAPLKICGAIHGQYYDLLRLFEYGGFPPEANYLFLGRYVDHGKQSLETICLLMAYKIRFPENFFMLRGSHECASINRIHGFYDECKRRYNIKLWKCFTDVFNCLPVAAIIDEKIFCMSGGLSPDLQSMEQIRRIMRPTDVPDTGLLCDLLWADPDKDIAGWGENARGVSFSFGGEVVQKFLHKHDMDLIVRTHHEALEDGYEFFAKRQLVTLHSAPNYCGEFDNAGAMMSVDDVLMCSFQILKPAETMQKFPYGGEGSGRPITPPRGGGAKATTGVKSPLGAASPE